MWPGTLGWHKTRVQLTCDYGNESTCLIYEPGTPSTLPYTSSSTFDVVGIVLICSNPHVYNNMLRTDFGSFSCTRRHNMSLALSPTTRPSRFQADRLTENPCLPGFHSSRYYWIRLHFIRTFSNCSVLSLRHSSIYSQMLPVFQSGPSSITSYSNEILLKNQIMRQCWVTLNPALKAEVNHLPVTRRLDDWKMTSEVTHWKQSRDQSLEID